MIKETLLTAILTAVLIGSTIGHAIDHADTNIENTMDMNMDIQALLQEYVDDNESVGASVGLIDKGKINFFSYGKRSVDGNEAVSEDTVFEIGSITKVFTTLALMDMVAKGEVQLDDPIELYLPGVKIPEKDGMKITLRHLATHNSGIPRMPDNFNPKNPSNPYEDYSTENLYEFLNKLILQKTPGEQFEYSNIGMGLLGHILCLKSGKNYDQLISDAVSRQLGMKNTGIALTPKMEEQFAKGHHLGQPVEHWDLTQSMAGAGALRSNVKDMTQFLAANMGLLNSPVTDLLRQCHNQQHEPAPTIGVGLGWILNRSNDATVIMHNGGTGGFRAYLGFSSKAQKGIVILTNSTSDWPDELGASFLDPEFKKPSIDKALAKDQGYLNKFVGSYDANVFVVPDQPKQTLQISIFGKQLASSLSCGEVGMLYPQSFGIFGIKGYPDGRVQFSFDEEGNISKVQALILSTGTTAWEATPKLPD